MWVEENPAELTGHGEHFVFYSQCNETAVEGFKPNDMI